MVVRKVGDTWEVSAPAKLNLYLDILGRREDGFHELETLMAPIRVYDRLRWSPSADADERPFTIEYDQATSAEGRAAAPLDEQNLVWRAANLLACDASREPTGRITLLKRIPAQAGLGGGSSDAAATLLLANAAWGLSYPQNRLLKLAAELGSDVPFFLAGESAICRGRGELVEPVGPLPRLDVVVVKPPAGVSTAEAYDAIQAPPVTDERRRGSSSRLAELLDRLRRGSLATASRLMTNSLQSAAESLCSPVECVRRAAAGLGGYASLMTGSGSACFGVMRSARHASRAAALLSSRGLGTVFATSTCR
jgi:4-diphosphocytidyl-2-C-methyl-D-erythritol kinase